MVKIKRSVWILAASLMVICLILGVGVLADPSGPTSLTTVQSSRGSTIPAAQVGAQAGNITELNINATSITQTWQGYYGNITGTLTLDNANNWTLYDWRMITPSGKVYATRNDTGISWQNISCANSANISAEDSYLGSANYPDAVNETFKYASSSFFVGSVQVSNCPATFTYINDTNQTSLFQEALLMDTTKNALVYTSLINGKTVGFDNRSHDFQMIVSEKGRNGDTAVTPYYFYVELN